MIERGVKFHVLNDGFVQVVDWMGDDFDICTAAYRSHHVVTKSVPDDRNLIRYLMGSIHAFPFDQCELKLYLRMPMNVMNQYIVRCNVSLNECSARFQATRPDEWRLQSGTDKQGLSGFVTEWPDQKRLVDLDFSPGEYLSTMEKNFHIAAKDLYEERLRFGVAREQACKDLPLCTYSEEFWRIDLHSLLRFLRLCMDSHAQLEIRSYANIIGNDIVSQLWPLTWEAFLETIGSRDYH